MSSIYGSQKLSLFLCGHLQIASSCQKCWEGLWIATNTNMWCFLRVFKPLHVFAQHPCRSQRETNSLNTGGEPKSFEAANAQPAALFSSVSSRHSPAKWRFVRKNRAAERNWCWELNLRFARCPPIKQPPFSPLANTLQTRLKPQLASVPM